MQRLHVRKAARSLPMAHWNARVNRFRLIQHNQTHSNHTEIHSRTRLLRQNTSLRGPPPCWMQRGARHDRAHSHRDTCSPTHQRGGPSHAREMCNDAWDDEMVVATRVPRGAKRARMCVDGVEMVGHGVLDVFHLMIALHAVGDGDDVEGRKKMCTLAHSSKHFPSQGVWYYFSIHYTSHRMSQCVSHLIVE